VRDLPRNLWWQLIVGSGGVVKAGTERPGRAAAGLCLVEGRLEKRSRRVVCISVVVPVLNEAATIPFCLTTARERALPEEIEIIVVDGGSGDSTVALAEGTADKVLSAPRGRASQMNAGARVASAEILLFLHADTILPHGYARYVQAAMAQPGVVGGRFDVRLDSDKSLLRLAGAMINLRSRLSRIATGDQAIFVRREVFARLGGYPAIPLFEDIVLSKNLKRAGRFACLRDKVTTSARRWEKEGACRTILRMWVLRALFWAGVPAGRLRELYDDAR